MLYQRYGNPLMLLEQMLMTGRFSEWVSELLRIHNQEVEEKAQWEFYLHRIYDQSFEDFVNAASRPSVPVIADMNEVETTVRNSLEVLETFKL